MNKLSVQIHKPPIDLKDTSLAIGFFDGLHLGHLELIQETKKSSYPSAVLTFTSDLKDKVEHKSKSLLLTDTEKDNTLSKLGVDYEYVLPFNRETMSTSQEDFIQFLKAIHCREIVVGDDFTFGSCAKGRATDLLALKKDGILVKIITLKEFDGSKISSTRIKKLLEQGDVKEANKLLGYPFFYTNKVIHGLHNGYILGFPTANMRFPKDKVLLPPGVYKTKTLIDGTCYDSMTNIGNHPTIDALNDNIVETYILDQNINLYGKEVTVSFLDKIRDQICFSSIDELKTQLWHDKEACKS